MTQGISTAEFEEQFGKEIHAVYGGVLKKYEAVHLLRGTQSGGLALTRRWDFRQQCDSGRFSAVKR